MSSNVLKWLALLNRVTSLGAPATLSDVETEQSNFTKIVLDLNDKKQDIKDKK